MRKILGIWLVSCFLQVALSGLGSAAVTRHAGFFDDDEWARRPRGHNRLFSQIIPNDPYFHTSNSWGQGYDDLWGVKRIGADRAWDVYRGAGINIAIVDSGVYFHEDIGSNIWENAAELKGRPGVDDDRNGFVDDIRGWDFVNNDNVPTDENGHGTHVGGIAGAIGFNAKGIIGVAPSAKIMRVRVLDAAGGGGVNTIANGIRYAARMGAKVINLSLGGVLDSASRSVLQQAVNYAHSLGSILLAAVGNNASNADSFSPANLDYVLGVGATDFLDRRAGFSNFGSKLDFMAPGVDILSLGTTSTHIGAPVASNYYYASGTSMATPLVSGAVALLLNKYPGANVFTIKKYLTSGATDLGAAGWDPYYGFGRINVARSLGLAGSTTTSSSSTMRALEEINGRNAVLSQMTLQRNQTDSRPSEAPHRDRLQKCEKLIA